MKRLLPALAVLLLLVSPAAGQEVVLTGSAQDAETLALLAVDYLEGQGVEQSDVDALKWWLISRSILQPVDVLTPENAHLILKCGLIMDDAKRRLAGIEERMAPVQIAQAQRMAREWLEKDGK